MKKIDLVVRALRDMGSDKRHRAAAVADHLGIPYASAQAWLSVARMRNLVDAVDVGGQWEYKSR